MLGVGGVGWEEDPKPLSENTPGKRGVRSVFSGIVWAPDLSEDPAEIMRAASPKLPRAHTHTHFHTRDRHDPQLYTHAPRSLPLPQASAL